MSQRIAIIGLGAMGAAMAQRLLRAGFDVAGFDLRPEPMAKLVKWGGRAASTPADAGWGAVVAVVMVHDALQADRALFGEAGAAAALEAGAVVWLASTVTPDDAREFDRRLVARGLLMVDGPVSGGMTGAQDGELTVIAGAGAAAMEAAAGALHACASHVFHVGEVGAGSTVKMINQLLVASHLALAAEAVAFGVKAGVNAAQLVEVVMSSAGNSRMFEKRAPRMVAGDDAPHSTVKTFLKDLNIALDVAQKLKFPTPVAAAAHQVFTMAAGCGYADESDTRVLRVYEQLGGVRVAAEGTA